MWRLIQGGVGGVKWVASHPPLEIHTNISHINIMVILYIMKTIMNQFPLLSHFHFKEAGSLCHVAKMGMALGGYAHHLNTKICPSHPLQKFLYLPL